QVHPGEAADVPGVSPVGAVSTTTTFVAADRPALVTTREKVSGAPMRAGPVCVLTTARSTTARTSTGSLASLLPGAGSVVAEVTSAVLTKVPGVTSEATWTTSVRVGASSSAAIGSVPSSSQVTVWPAPVTAPA